MSIIVSRGGLNAVRLERTVIEKEDYLQRYIHVNPDVLPLHDIKEDLRLLVLAREFPTSSGPIDALGIDADGDIYIIETKLYKNPDKRLVLAQALDYGASLWQTYSDPSEFLSRLDQYVRGGHGKPLASVVTEFFQVDDAGYTELIDSTKQNVSTGSFRFIVLMDRLDERLKHLISFVNTNASFDIIGVELDYYQHDGFEIIIPTLYGTEARKDAISRASTSQRRTWDEDQFFKDARARLSTADLNSLRKLFDWTTSNADDYPWGSGRKRGSFGAKFNVLSPKSAFSVLSDGDIWLNLDYLLASPASAPMASQLVTTLRDRGFTVASETGHPTIKISQWGPRVDILLDVFSNVFLRVAKG